MTFRAVAPDEANAVISNARVFVGHYEARISPVADTNPATNATGTGANNLDDVAAFVPGTYEFVVQARRLRPPTTAPHVRGGSRVHGDVLVPDELGVDREGCDGDR